MIWIEKINGATIFQFCAALSSIIGLVITYFTWIRTKNVEQAVRELRMTQINRDVYLSRFDDLFVLLSGIKDDPQYLQKSELKTSEDMTIKRLARSVDIIRKSVDDGYKWFSYSGNLKERDKKLENMLTSVKNIEELTAQELLNGRDIEKLLKYVDRLCTDIEAEKKFMERMGGI